MIRIIGYLPEAVATLSRNQKLPRMSGTPLLSFAAPWNRSSFSKRDPFLSRTKNEYRTPTSCSACSNEPTSHPYDTSLGPVRFNDFRDQIFPAQDVRDLRGLPKMIRHDVISPFQLRKIVEHVMLDEIWDQKTIEQVLHSDFRKPEIGQHIVRGIFRDLKIVEQVMLGPFWLPKVVEHDVRNDFWIPEKAAHVVRDEILLPNVIKQAGISRSRDNSHESRMCNNRLKNSH